MSHIGHRPTFIIGPIWFIESLYTLSSTNMNMPNIGIYNDLQ